MIDFIYALKVLYPNIVFTEDKKGFDKDGNEVAYDKNAVQAYLESHNYISKRAAEYPSFADQFDILYHGGYDAWKATIQAVKDKYPKEQS
jgi:hypothetical protein